VPSLFRRKSSDLVTDPVAEANTRAGKAKTSGTKASKAASPATKASSLKTNRLAGPAKTATAKATTPEPDAAEDGTLARPRGYTPSKKDLGQATPKRKGGGRTAEPPPANRREAYRRLRAKERDARAEARAGAMAGKSEYLPARDQGPERALVRDIVDSRHSLSRGFMPAALFLVLITSGAVPVPIRLAGNLLFYVLILGVIVDNVLLCRRIKRVLPERFPKSSTPPRSHYFYGIMRALSFRKLRMPRPQVKVGEKI
jgi:hypothetical protein